MEIVNNPDYDTKNFIFSCGKKLKKVENLGVFLN